MELDERGASALLEDLLLVRRFEETCLRVYEDEGIPELPHLSIGQEAVGVGGLHAVADDDWVVPSLRTRAVMLLRRELEEVVAGMFGTVSGPSSGRTTQHHMGSTESYILGTTGLVGSHLNAANGAALTAKILDQDRVTLVFFGDGAVQRGEFHTALNFAAVNRLPVVFLIENNGWTEATRVEDVTPVDELAELAVHVPSRTIDGQDVETVVEAVVEAADRARAGDGPSLVEALTHRFRPHAEVMEEPRSREELDALSQEDPVKRFRERIEESVLSSGEIEAIEDRVEARVEAAFAAVEDDPLPDEDVMYHVYADWTIDHATGRVIR